MKTIYANPLMDNSVSRSPLRRPPVFFPVLFVCFALSPRAQALVPTPDGGYPGANTAEGSQALFSLSSFARESSGNTARGYQALYSDTTGSRNTATGSEALRSNNADANTATGYQALFSNTTGVLNTAIGTLALRSNIGGSALLEGNANTAIGASALQFNKTGGFNTATGYSSLLRNTTGGSNTAIGGDALQNNESGSGNIALGVFAGSNLTAGDNNIDIGNSGVAGDSDTIKIGTVLTQTKTFVAGISGTAVTGEAVAVNASGQLGVVPSSQRFKDAVKPMDKASEAILALKPVIFCYKKELDPKGIPQFGLVAEDVAKVNPDLVVRDAEGKVYTVRYEAVNAMLLNEFLKEHRKVEQLEVSVAQQQKGFESKLAEQREQIKALTAGLQKMSAQFESSKPRVQFVENN